MRRAFALGLIVLVAGCSWRGTPKTPVEGDYSSCMKSCGPGGACVREGDGWKCLPPAFPVTPATSVAK